jgi:hypothetical protein
MAAKRIGTRPLDTSNAPHGPDHQERRDSLLLWNAPLSPIGVRRGAAALLGECRRESLPQGVPPA